MKIKISIIMLIWFGLLPEVQAQKCVVFGTYKSIPSVAYDCSFGLVSFNYSSWSFIDMGNGKIKVRGAPTGTIPELDGNINCDDSTFSAGVTISGSCTEAYKFDGKFDNDTSWYATLKIMFSGSNCFDCVNQTFEIKGTTNHISDIGEVNRLIEYTLFQNYPNPFNPVTKIEYAIDSKQYAILKVYDVLGNEVATLVNEDKEAGSYEVEFDASSLTSGVYYYRLQAGTYIETKKMLLLK